MGTSVVVNQQNFDTTVVQQSFETPVIVDFFATWCGPCQLLKPILEKLVQEYDFVLATVDIDQNPELANAYGIEGVPDVRIVSEGRVMKGFVGVLTEPQLRDFLGRLNLKSKLETGLEAIQVARVAGDINEAGRLFQSLLATYPENPSLALDAARFWLEQDDLEAAEAAIAPLSQHDRQFGSQIQAMRELIQFKREAANPVITSEVDTQFLQAIQATLAGQHEAALQGFLEIVGRDRKYRNDGARKAMLTVFNLLGDDHALTRDYRKKLMQTLY